MSPIKTARSLACPPVRPSDRPSACRPPAAVSNVVPSQQRNTLFNFSSKVEVSLPRGWLSTNYYGRGVASAGGVVRWRNGRGCSRQISSFCLSKSNLCPSYQCHFYWWALFCCFFFPLSPFFFFLQRPHKIFQLAETNCHPHTIWQTEMQLDSSTCKAKKTVQMDQKREQVLFFQVRLFVCFKVNLQGDFFLFRLLLFFFLHEAQSSPSGPTVTAVPLIEDDNITAGLPPSLFFDWNKTHSMPICAAKPISSSSDGMA